MSGSLVSILVPTYNRAYCLPATIDSALAQTHRDLEILIVDDGSKDETPDLVKKLYGGESRVKYHYQKNGGPAAAKNTGLTLATGDYIALLDSDDLWLPWKIELQLACMRENPAIGMVWSDMDAMDSTGRITHTAYIRKMYHCWNKYSAEDMFGPGKTVTDLAATYGGALPGEIAAGKIPGGAKFYSGMVFSQMIMGCLVHTSTVIMRKERAQKVKCWNLEFTPIGEDYDFHLRTCKEGMVGFLDVPTIKYQTGNPDQLTRPALRALTAINCLRTIEPYIASGEGINIPRATLKRRVADVHDWASDALFQNGDYAGSRQHAIKALQGYPWRPRRWKILAASCLPASCMRMLGKSPASKAQELPANKAVAAGSAK